MSRIDSDCKTVARVLKLPLGEIHTIYVSRNSFTNQDYGKIQTFYPKTRRFAQKKRKRTAKVNQYVEGIIEEIHELYGVVCKKDIFQLLDHDADYRDALSNCYKRLD